MSPWAALNSLRIGCVQYLNARPLIYGYDGPVVFDHPSALARDIARGGLDAGLVPIFEALRARDYTVADGVAIACDGPVYSVFLAYRGPLEKIRTVALDPGSLTSVHLLQVLLAEYHGLRPFYGQTGEADALLLIGNQAIDFRLANPGTHQFLDLGEEWKRCTGLPFVFAVWLLRPDLENLGAIGDAFRALQRHGLAHIAEIVASETFHDAEFRHRYLTSYIRFQLGAAEKEAIEKFRALLSKHGFIAADIDGLQYV
ncbi:MAG: mqnA [Chthoniobacteraceae bacterium]|nr:mqnA [Chthoniobacteraceae bacterium]